MRARRLKDKVFVSVASFLYPSLCSCLAFFWKTKNTNSVVAALVLMGSPMLNLYGGDQSSLRLPRYKFGLWIGPRKSGLDVPGDKGIRK